MDGVVSSVKLREIYFILMLLKAYSYRDRPHLHIQMLSVDRNFKYRDLWYLIYIWFNKVDRKWNMIILQLCTAKEVWWIRLGKFYTTLIWWQIWKVCKRSGRWKITGDIIYWRMRGGGCTNTESKCSMVGDTRIKLLVGDCLSLGNELLRLVIVIILHVPLLLLFGRWLQL